MRLSRSWNLVILAAIGLSGCAPTPAATPTAQPTTPPITLKVLNYSDTGTVPLRQFLESGAAEQALGFKVEYIEKSYDDTLPAMVAQGATRSGEVDVFMIDDPWLPELALKGYLADLTALGYTPDAGFIPTTLDLGYWPPRTGPRVPSVAADTPAHLYALPLIGDTQIFFYRKDLIQPAPETWDDLKTIAAAQTDPEQGVYLMAMRGVAGNPIVTEWFPYLYSFGGEIFDDQWQPVFNDAAGVAALELYVDLMQYQPADVATYNSAEQGVCYLSGQCLTNIEWTGWLSPAEDPAQSQVVGQTGWVLTPKQTRHASQIGNWLVGVAADSKNASAARAFVEWITSDPAQLALAQRGSIPVRQAVFTNATVQQKYPWLPVVGEALNNAVARPRTPNWSQVEALLGEHLHRAVLKEETPQAALEAAAEEITVYLTQQGYYK